MSDGTGGDPTSVAVGAGIVGAVGLVIAAIRALFTRNVGAVDRAQEEMRENVKAILLELRSMHDEQTRQRSEIITLTEKIATLKDSLKAAHDRIDALVATPPGQRGRK